MINEFFKQFLTENFNKISKTKFTGCSAAKIKLASKEKILLSLFIF